MAEISNNMLAVLVVTAFVVVIASALINFVDTDSLGISGRASTDTGNVSLIISQTLAIQVDTSNSAVNFGTCTPRPSSSYSCATNDAVACDASASSGNCTGDTTTPQYIRLDNVGNVDASINITNSNNCAAAQLIGGTSPAITYQSTNCNGTNVTSWAAIPASSTATQLFCNNLSYRGPGQVRMYFNVTIPNNAVPAGGCTPTNTTRIQFSAIQI